MQPKENDNNPRPTGVENAPMLPASQPNPQVAHSGGENGATNKKVASDEQLFPQMPGHPFEAALYKDEMNIINREEEIKKNQKTAKAQDEANKKRLNEIRKSEEESKSKKSKMDPPAKEAGTDTTKHKKDKKRSRAADATRQSSPDRNSSPPRKSSPSRKSTPSKKSSPSKKSTPSKKSAKSTPTKSRSKSERSSRRKEVRDTDSSADEAPKLRASRKKGGKTESMLDLQDPTICTKMDSICSLVVKAAKGDPDMALNGDKPEPMTEVS